jgi:putative intracellular protease/amidase
MRALVVAASTLALLTGLSQPAVSRAQPRPAVTASVDSLTLPPPKAGRLRPLIVVVAGSGGAETTDFVVPYGILKESGVADVRSLSTAAGPIQLLRRLKVAPDATVAAFDRDEPLGADVVIVPAQGAPKDAVLGEWVRAQAAKGATIVSVCEGARVLANAGLLNGRRAVTHWSAMKGLKKAYPETTWVRDRSYVQDGPIISTAGVTAAIPMSLALVEAIAGRPAAEAAARKVGVDHWGAAHRSDAFQLTKGDIAGGLMTFAAFWSHETVELPLEDGVDDVALALRADAWGRSLRAKVVTTHLGLTAVRSRHGLVILPDAEPRSDHYTMRVDSRGAVAQLDATLSEMGRRYGAASVRLAELGLEYGSPSRGGR